MRPRLCAVCHQPATHAIDTVRPATRLTRDGTAIRFTITVATYYCTNHHQEGITAA